LNASGVIITSTVTLEGNIYMFLLSRNRTDVTLIDEPIDLVSGIVDKRILPEILRESD